MKFPSDYKDVLTLPMEGHLQSDSINEEQLEVLLDQVCKILPDLSDSNQQGHFPLVSPEELEERIRAIRAFNRHLVPRMRDSGSLRLQPCLSLAMDNCHSLVLQSLAAAAHNSARGDDAAALSAIRIPQVILNSLRTLVIGNPDSGSGGNGERVLLVPKMCMTMLVPIFQHCLDCSSRPSPPAIPVEYQRSLRDVFEESKHIMGALEGALAGELPSCALDDEAEDLTDTMHLLAELVKILPRLDSRYFGRMARLFLDVSRKNRMTLTADKMLSRPAEIVDVTAALVVEHSTAVRRFSSAVVNNKTSSVGDASLRKLESHTNKLHFLLGLLKDLADLFCDQLGGADFALITRGLSTTLSLNDASLEFCAAIPNEVSRPNLVLFYWFHLKVFFFAG